jgi:sugar O-acyltransferase (sialic acid O-acetyltransferase NeuD family)
MKSKIENFNEQKVINILGYAGSYLALLFETLSSLKYKGIVRIFLNDQEKRAIAPFETDIDYKEIFYSKPDIYPESGFIFCSNKPSTKRFLFNFYAKEWNVNTNGFINLIHPSSVVASTVDSGNGTYIEPMSVVSAYTALGFGVTINRNCSVGHHNIIGDYSSIHPGSNLAGHIVVGKNVTIGPGSTVFSHLAIGDNSIIGGGSVVTKDIPENVIAFGNPCKVIKSLNLEQV